MAKQTERHAKLLRVIILGDGQEGVASLAQALGVSSKTIRRDLTALRELGFAIEEHHGPHGHKSYWLSKDAMPQIKFTYDEAFALMLCGEGEAAFDGTPIGAAAENGFEKIRVALGPLEQRYLDRMMPRVHRSAVGGDYSAHAEVVDARHRRIAGHVRDLSFGPQHRAGDLRHPPVRLGGTPGNALRRRFFLFSQ